jgi:hypothetical protein
MTPVKLGIKSINELFMNRKQTTPVKGQDYSPAMVHGGFLLPSKILKATILMESPSDRRVVSHPMESKPRSSDHFEYRS